MIVLPVRHWYGFSLSLLTAFMWGILPVFIKLCLELLDAVTITWYRFMVAGLVVYFVLMKKRALPNIKKMGRNKVLLLLVASILLVANYVTNVKGKYTNHL
jgi:drug/metabolite transporter (DMT)-like permease